MDIENLIIERRSIRKYINLSIEKSVFEKIIDIARYSPSWKNTQTVHYIIIQNKELKAEIAEKYACGFVPNIRVIKNADALVIVCSKPSRSGYEEDGAFSTNKGTHWESFDAGIAVQTFCLASYSLGLGTLIIGVYNEAQIIQAVGMPDGHKISALIAVGFPNETPIVPKRKDVSEIVSFLP